MAARPPLLRVCELSTHAWEVSYADAIADAQLAVVEGVHVPFLGLDALIASKEAYREQDAADRVKLLALKRKG